MKKNKVFLTLFLAACAACFGAGYSLKKVSTIYVDVPRTEVDTVFVQVMPVNYQNIPAVHGQAKQGEAQTNGGDVVADSVGNNQVVGVGEVVVDSVGADYYVELDTTLSANGRDYGRLNLWYYPRPDVFSLAFEPAPMPVIQTTKYVEKERRWFSNPVFTLGVGVLAGVIVTQSRK